MPTQRQIEANRLNALQSTGPRTPEGKAVSARNALKSGLDADSQFVIGENREAFAELQDEYTTRFQPVTPEERFLVDILLRDDWILRRLFRAESFLWEYHTIRASRSDNVQLGEALHNGSDHFSRLQRRITLLERSYKDTFERLQSLQAARRLESAPGEPPDPVLSTPQPAAAKTQTPKLASFLKSSPRGARPDTRCPTPETPARPGQPGPSS